MKRPGHEAAGTAGKLSCLLYVQWGLGVRECQDWWKPWTGNVSTLQN